MIANVHASVTSPLIQFKPLAHMIPSLLGVPLDIGCVSDALLRHQTAGKRGAKELIDERKPTSVIQPRVCVKSTRAFLLLAVDGHNKAHPWVGRSYRILCQRLGVCNSLSR